MYDTNTERNLTTAKYNVTMLLYCGHLNHSC